MGEHPDYGDDPYRNRRRRRDYTDDGWGMAEYEDYADGDAGSVGDYAGGLVYEEGSRQRYYEGDDYQNPTNISDDNQYTVASAAPDEHWRSRHISGSSNEGMERAANLLQRMNERNSYPAAQQAPPTSQARPAQRVAADNDVSAVYSAGIIMLILIATLSCTALVFYATLG